MDTETNRYQITCFFSPLLDKQQLEDAISRLKKRITDSDGTTEEEKTRRQNLAYKIKHFQDAFYMILNFTIAPADLEKLTTKLKLDNDVLRHLIVHANEQPAVKAAKKTVKKLKKEKANLLKELIVEKPEEIKKLTEEQTQTEPKPKSDNISLGKEKVNLVDLDKKLDEILNE